MMTSRPRTRALRAVVAMLLLSLAAVACGGSDKASSTDSGEQSDAPPTDAALAEAKKVAASFVEPPSSIPVSEPLEELPTGKSIYYVVPQLEISLLQAEEFKRAASHLGMDVTIISRGNTPEMLNDAFDRVVNEKPDGVVAIASEVAQWQAQYDQVKAAGIPVMMIAANQEDNDEVINFWGFDESKRGGRIVADWIIADSRGDANVAIFYPVILPIIKGTEEGMASELADKCPACTSSSIEVSVADVQSGKLSSIITDYLVANPDVNYVFAGVSEYLVGVREALNNAGVEDVKLVSQGGVSATFERIANGQQEADLAYPHRIVNWLIADTFARIFAGQDISVAQGYELDHQILTKESMTFPESSELWPGYDDLEADFKAVWGVK